MNKTQMVKALREIIETPDDVQEWERLEGEDSFVTPVAVVDVERLKALLPEPKATVPDGDRDEGVLADRRAGQAICGYSRDGLVCIHAPGHGVPPGENIGRHHLVSADAAYTTSDVRARGVTFDPELDFERLNKQMQAVWSVVRTGRWYSLNQLAELTGCPTPSVSARLRDLRKPKFGEQEVQSRREAGGYWVYRVVRSQP